MPVYLSRSWTRAAPSGMVDIDWRNPLTVGLRRVFLASCGLYDPARRAFWQNIGGLPWVRDSNRYGGAIHLHNGGTSSYVSSLENIPTAGWTIGMVYTPINGVGNKLVGFTEAPGNGTNDRALISNTGSIGYTATLFDGGTKTSGGTGIPDQFGSSLLLTGQCHVVVGRCTKDFVLQAWCNGHPGTTTACANNGFASYTTPEFCVGNVDSATGITDASIGMAFYVNRDWTDEEVLSWSLAPFQLFKARPARIAFAPPVIVGGSAARMNSYYHHFTGHTR